jgi:L-rhamnose mutarotase
VISNRSFRILGAQQTTLQPPPPQARHSPIWPELEATLKAHGAHNYSIFLDRQNNQLISYVEIEDKARWNAIARIEICQK